MKAIAKRGLAVLIAMAVLGGVAVGPGWAKDAAKGAAADAKDAKKQPPAKIQMAILLDCSGSMSGLINQARTQLWNTVNEFAKAEHGGQPVMLEVALYEYGSSRYPSQQGYLKRLVPLTDDLDRVSEALFALKTSGSQEFCGQVIDAATRELAWSDARRDMKCIFIAGNEGFTQGPIDFRKACQAAIAKDITVSTIHCGPQAQGVAGKWDEGAKLADGSFTSIDQNQQITAIPTPQDKELVRLNAELNTTYVAYGTVAKQKAAVKRQVAQDSNAAKSNVETLASRVAFKSNVQYCNTSWDLVDACKRGKLKLEDLKEEELPEAVRKLNPEERMAYIEKVAKQRLDIQQQIKTVNAERGKFLAEARKKQGAKQGNTLDEAIVAAVRKQAARKNYEFKK